MEPTSTLAAVLPLVGKSRALELALATATTVTRVAGWLCNQEEPRGWEPTTKESVQPQWVVLLSGWENRKGERHSQQKAQQQAAAGTAMMA